MKKYKECEKLAKVSEESNKIGAFLDWLINDRGLFICEENTDSESDQEFYQSWKTIEDLLAEYFQIDMNKIEKERRQMLAELQQKEKTK